MTDEAYKPSEPIMIKESRKKSVQDSRLVIKLKELIL